MANPAWVTATNVKFNGTLNNAAVLKDTGTVKSLILWDNLSAADQAILVAAVNDNGGTIPLSGPTSGHQTLSYHGTAVGANPTGLNNTATATAGKATINLGGVAIAVNPSGLAITGNTAGYQMTSFANGTTSSSASGFIVPTAGNQTALFTPVLVGGNASGLSNVGPVATFGTITAGSGYTPGVYTGVVLTGGTGSNATATITVNVDGTVHAAGVVLVSGGAGYTAANSLTAPALPGGSAFAVAVATITPVTYTTTVTIDGTPHAVSIAGPSAQTVTLVLAAINTAIGVAGTAAIDGNGNLTVTAASSGTSSSVLMVTGTLFPALTGFQYISAAIAGAGTTAAVTATVTIDGTPHAFSVSRSTMLTFSAVISALQTAIGGAGTVSMVGPDIKIISATTGSASKAAIADGTTPNGLFANMTGFQQIEPAHNGVSKARTYAAVANIDGVLVSLNTGGAVGDTYQHVVDAMNVDLGSAGTAAITGGNIVITSATTGVNSSVTLADTGVLCNSLTGYVGITSLAGVALTTYTASVNIDGTAHAVSVVGNAVQTFTQLVAALNTAIGIAGTAAITSGDITITSASTGVASSVLVTEGDLFDHTTGFAGAPSTAVPGAVDFENVMNTTRGPTGTTLYSYFPVAHVGLKPAVPPFCPHTTKFIYWNGSVWKYLDNDATV